ncbi:MAG: ABC transporter permease [Lentisphaeria bacterium]|nr:ABC transporter permease [Lentisphaeria bacterium]
MLNTLRDILDFRRLPEIAVSNRSLLWQFVKRSVSARYRGSMLGIFWSFIQPMMMLCVYTFVFSVVFRSRWGTDIGSGRGSFAIILFCGLALFNLFSEAVTLNSGIIVSNTNLVKKVIFPLEILPLSQTLATFAVGMVWFFLLFLGTVFVFGKLSFTMLLLPLVLIPLFLFTLGVSFFTASLGVYVRDTSYAVGVVLQILFFLTPIFYPVSAIPERFRWPILLNPLTILIEEARKVFLYGELPDWRFLGAAFLISLLVLHLGFLWFHKTKKGFADVL